MHKSVNVNRNRCGENRHANVRAAVVQNAAVKPGQAVRKAQWCGSAGVRAVWQGER